MSDNKEREFVKIEELGADGLERANRSRVESLEARIKAAKEKAAKANLGDAGSEAKHDNS